MIDFTSEQLDLIVKVLDAKLVDLESCYKRNVNSRPDYASYIAACMPKYLQIIEKIDPSYQFMSFSPSLKKFLYGDRNLDVVDEVVDG